MESPTPTHPSRFPIWILVLATVVVVGFVVVLATKTPGQGTNAPPGQNANAGANSKNTLNANAAANSTSANNVNRTANYNTASNSSTSTWTRYTNSVVGYELLVPPDSTIDEGPGLIGAGAPGTKGYCVTLAGAKWYVTIHANDDQNQAICGRSGVAAGDVSESRGTITIATRSYILTFFEVDPPNRYGNHDQWLEVKDVDLGSGIQRITGEGKDPSTGVSLQNFLDSRDTIKTVIESIKPL